MSSLSEILLPKTTGLHLESVTVNEQDKTIRIIVHSTQQEVYCPCCHQPAGRIHSHYWRRLTDLPCTGMFLYWRLRVRRFYCNNNDCLRQIFTERIPVIAASYARRTQQLVQAQQAIALTLGGIAGERLSQQLQMPASLDTLLRSVRCIKEKAASEPRIVGIDDWAWRKGYRYGTVLVDLETGQIVDLLADRQVETVTAWLQKRPEVTLISRDRAGAYAEAARLGAPQATQVADRWHLIRNLSEVLIQILQPHEKTLKQITVASPSEQQRELSLVNLEMMGSGASITANDHEQQQQRRQKRLERYETVHRLGALGWTTQTIASETGLNTKTVRRFLRVTTFPERQPRQPRGSILDPYKPFLLKRWNEGCRTGAKLLQEIRSQGYTGGTTVVNAFMAQVRRVQGLPPKTRMVTPAKPVRGITENVLTVRRMTWLILARPEKQEPTDELLLNKLMETVPHLAQAVRLSRSFVTMLRQRQPDALDDWLAAADQSPYSLLSNFSRGLRRDYAAVKGALTETWSNGPVEGHINRLKFVKRQMYGRANFDLLRLRVLYAH